jgi:hypothetical protein
MIEWFRRLADVPNVGYPGDPRVKRSALSGHNSVPKQSVHTFDGRRHESLTWTTKDGTTSASPASSHSFGDLSPNQPVEAHLRWLSEVLELPGTASDYHFAIQRCVEELWRRRRQDPTVLPTIDQLCWLNIRLIEARPNAITYERDGKKSYFRVLAFGYLIQLYEREGYVAEALDVAERAARFDNEGSIEDLRVRLAQLEAEIR